MKRQAQSLIEISLVAVFAVAIGFVGWSTLGGNIQSLLHPSMVTSDANTARYVGSNNVSKVNNDLNTLGNSKNSSLQNLVNTIRNSLNSGRTTGGIETSGAMALFLAKNDTSGFTASEQTAITDLKNTLPQATSDMINIANQLAALINTNLTITASTSTADKYNDLVSIYNAANGLDSSQYTADKIAQIQGLLTQLKVQLTTNSQTVSQ